MKPRNLFAHGAVNAATESVDTLVAAGMTRLERIVSHAHASAPGLWYDQPQAEWVVVLSGSAGLRFEDSPEVVVLRPGDHLTIPAHCRHRVEWTAAGVATVWLALHYTEAE